MKGMRALRNILAYLLAFFLVPLLFIPVLIVSGLCGYDKFLFILSRAVMRFGLKIVGVRMHVHGAAGVDFSRPMLMVCNHLSNLDGPLLYSALPGEPRVLIKSEARKIPLIGLVLKLAGFVFVDRQSPRRRQEALNEAVAAIKKKRCSFLVFPEGTRSRSGRRQDFKKGGFMIALKAGVPVLPVKISGSYQLMPPGRITIRAGTVDIECFPLQSMAGVNESDLPGWVRTLQNTIYKDNYNENH
ncbi:MAG: lysophospholipid acyltransferase family protein [Candidatus Aminicenantes bacterium]|nr:lysophospholipid acyltransferase family protein [Candidatus Aminicenantes bacterium]